MSSETFFWQGFSPYLLLTAAIGEALRSWKLYLVVVRGVGRV